MAPIFTMGHQKKFNLVNETLQKYLQEESVYFGDILQTDFEDMYEMMVTKIYNTMSWFAETCPKTRHVIFGDADTMLFPRNIARFLAENAQIGQNTIFGFFNASREVLRETWSKWYNFE